MSQKPRRILVLAGGQSEEHEVSLMSARAVTREAEAAGFECTVQVVTREGGILGPAQSRVALAEGNASKGGTHWGALATAAQACDVVFPLIHGTLGEDGTLQGFLTLLGRPFIGSQTLASAVCMDKSMAKEVLKAHSIPQTDYLTITSEQWQTTSDTMATRITQNLAKPWFIKPANSGSSVGISRASDSKRLAQGIEEAFTYDRRIVVEAGVEKAREIEVGILGNGRPEASEVGEITYQAEFYDYHAKYHDNRSKIHIPADVPTSIAERVKEMAVQAYVLLDCAGFARIDFFYQPEHQNVLLNEINTLPGFTPVSMFPSLWQAKGVSYSALIQKLVDLALERHRELRHARARGPALLRVSGAYC
ncbi:D-alanyl-alanine synthetase A [Ceraceosorus guamensis]|uniref:D-alanyl-alanine synthetase A n=1 Tax=Ceraceosorus guamensis TaxID=1522189 RepID=A0A316WB59_9BASI|nr:D-alanyl-alanine synthetase A [Ceraceosorus guamensis]PWN46208.1 D-alanyl-alanine synthetase A [Ceraceosorus guamensis]